MKTAPCASCLAIPDDYRCPITLEVFARGVVAPDGFTYEESAIRRYLDTPREGPARSPMSGRPMPQGQLIANHTLMAAICAHPKAGRAHAEQLARLAPLPPPAPEPQPAQAGPRSPSLHHATPYVSMATVTGVGLGLGTFYQLGAEYLFGPLPLPHGFGAGALGAWLGGGTALVMRELVLHNQAAHEASTHVLVSGCSMGVMSLAGGVIGGILGGIGQYACCQNNFHGCYFFDLGRLGAQAGALLGTASGACYAAYALYRVARIGLQQMP